MSHLSRAEEQVLLAVWRLRKDAYCVTIREKLLEIEGRNWSLGAIYVPLYRLEKKGYLRSVLGEPTHERGGRSKRFYTLTREGVKALEEVRELQQKIWEGIHNLSYKE